MPYRNGSRPVTAAPAARFCPEPSRTRSSMSCRRYTGSLVGTGPVSYTRRRTYRALAGAAKVWVMVLDGDGLRSIHRAAQSLLDSRPISQNAVGLHEEALSRFHTFTRQWTRCRDTTGLPW